MNSGSKWTPIEICAQAENEPKKSPLSELANGSIPAFIIRRAFSAENCQKTIELLTDRDLLFDPTKPIPQKFIDQSIPEGYYREGKKEAAKYAWQTSQSLDRIRIDIGTSLGYRGSEKAKFLQHAKESNELFEDLFSPEELSTRKIGQNPINVIYENLSEIAEGRLVKTAHEPDGSIFGQAIFRAHYGGYAYKPHFDSVRLREARSEYSVFQFEHQFAGVLVLQNTSVDDKSAQATIHQCLWQPAVDEFLTQDTFHEHAEKEKIKNSQIHLDPGDLYFFNTRLIHEVPGVIGPLPRIVLATFIGFSENRDEIFVWA